MPHRFKVTFRWKSQPGTNYATIYSSTKEYPDDAVEPFIKFYCDNKREWIADIEVLAVETLE